MALLVSATHTRSTDERQKRETRGTHDTTLESRMINDYKKLIAEAINEAAHCALDCDLTVRETIVQIIGTMSDYLHKSECSHFDREVFAKACSEGLSEIAEDVEAVENS